MIPNQVNAGQLHDFQGAKTLIVGDVNSGKTRFTEKLASALCSSGCGSRIVVLDLAPESLRQIGGKMQLRGCPPELLYLTCRIVAPRLTGKNAAHVQQLAQANARAIEPLIDQVLAARRSILIINDASLYLQAGRLERFLAMIAPHETVVINAYRGDSFAPAPFTQVERERVDALADYCDRVIHL
jgi:hypothetical protein